MAQGVTSFPTAVDSATELFAVGNNATTTLANAAASNATSLDLVDASKFVAPGAVTIVTAGVPVIRYFSGKSTNTLTGVTATGQDGTTAVAHAAGDLVEQRPIAAMHAALRGAIIAVQTALGANLANVQAADAELAALAGLSPSNDDVIQRKAGAWTNRTMAQVKTDLALTKGDVGLGNVDNTSDATKNAAAVTLTNKTLTAPTIADFTNANHDHLDADDGGTLSAAAIASGTVATARLGSGTADATTFLRGDQAWATPAGGIDWQGDWVTATPYLVGDAVHHGGSAYFCLVAHTAGVFATDLAAGKWDLLAAKGDAGAGDVVGPASAADGGVVVFDGATGKLVRPLDAGDFPWVQVELGLEIGADVLAYNAVLDDVASNFSAELNGIVQSWGNENGTRGAQLLFRDATATNFVRIRGAAAPSASRTILLPDADGTFYVSGGPDVALADGGTGASLADPNADRLMFWDDSAGAVAWLEPVAPLAVSGTQLGLGALTGILTGTATWNPASVANGAAASTTVTVTGAATGQPAVAGFASINGAWEISAVVSAANTVTVVITNRTGGAVDLASGTVRATVFTY